MKTILIFTFCFIFCNLQSQVDSLAVIFPIQEVEPDFKALEDIEHEPEPLNLEEVAKKIVYPKEAKDISISGKVIIRFLVSEQGTYIKHLVLSSPHASLTQEVERHIKDIKFKPGYQKGKTVKVWVTIPFTFSLTDDDLTKPILKKAYQWDLSWKIEKQYIDEAVEMTFYKINGKAFSAISMCSMFEQSPSDAGKIIKEVGGKIIKKNGDDYIFEIKNENRIGRLIFPDGYPCFLIIHTQEKLNKPIKNQMIEMIENKEILKINHQKI